MVAEVEGKGRGGAHLRGFVQLAAYDRRPAGFSVCCQLREHAGVTLAAVPAIALKCLPLPGAEGQILRQPHHPHTVDHPDVAQSLEGLAGIYFEQGRYADPARP